MSQKTKYYTLWIISMVLVIIYSYESGYVKKKASKVQDTIHDIDTRLKSENQIVDKINKTRQEYQNNKEAIGLYGISEGKLIDEINDVTNIANELRINVISIEVDPRNTFPGLEQNAGSDLIDLERQTVNFTFSGNFLSIGKFMDRVQNEKTNLRVQSVSIGLDSLDPRGVIAEMEYLTYGSSI
tara:strand:- start:196 stop:747 length:552 start_codon:yes stop_codon:yes gene_type:complete